MGIRFHKDWAFYAPFQFFWILVILPKFVQMAALGALVFLICFRSGKEKPLDGFTILQLVFCLIYGVAIVINAIAGEHELNRIFAAVNTWLITVVAVFMYHFYRHIRLDIDRLGKYALCNLVILILLWVVYTLTKGVRAFPILGHTLSGDDWVNGLYTPRFFGYLDYANLVVFAVLFFYPLALMFLRGKTLVSFGMTAVLFLVVKSTNSRTGLLLYLLVFLAYFLLEMQKGFYRFYKSRKYALLSLAVLAVVLVALVCFSQIAGILESLMGMREGSNGMRTMIYTESIRIMLEKSPIFGIGIKDMIGDYPLGSHSTYIGVFYKAGLLGGAVYVISMLYMGVRILLGKDVNRRVLCLKICLLAAMLLMALEDIDGANWCVCIFYALLALLQSSTETEQLYVESQSCSLGENLHEQ